MLYTQIFRAAQFLDLFLKSVLLGFFSAEKPLPQIATSDVISVIALLLAAGVLLGITITVLVLKIRSRKYDASYVNSSLSFCFTRACFLRHGLKPLILHLFCFLLDQ